MDAAAGGEPVSAAGNGGVTSGAIGANRTCQTGANRVKYIDTRKFPARIGEILWISD